MASGAFQISLNGTGFVNTSTINSSIGPLARNLCFADAHQRRRQCHHGHDFTVSVTNPAPGGGTSGTVTVHVTTSGTPVSSAAAVRFLEQASFGPDTETVYQVQETGFDRYLQNQFNAANTAYKDPTTTTQIYDLQRVWFLHAIAVEIS